MDSPATSPREAASPGPDTDGDAARVARAAAELGVPIPPGFRLAGMDEHDGHLAHQAGTAREIRNGIAILARLDGTPIEQCLAELTAPRPDGAAKPEWAPPDDLSDTDALLAYLDERERHPEWPRFTNSVADWAPLVAAFLGGAGIRPIAAAAASIHNERARLGLYRFIVVQAAAQGVEIDPAALIKAINPGSAGPDRAAGAAAEEPDNTNG